MRVSLQSNRPDGVSSWIQNVRVLFWRAGGAFTLFLLAVCASPVQKTSADDPPSSQNPPNDLKQLSLEQLGAVEVTSVSKDPQQVQKTPAAIFVITQEDIRRSGATSIPEALRLAPGVEVAQIDGNHWSVAIRGFAGQFSKSLLVLVDGRSIYTPLFEGVYWDLPYVMLEDVERIEVIRGPGGTIWGSNAVNGVINIITKSATTPKAPWRQREAELWTKAPAPSATAARRGKISTIASTEWAAFAGQEAHPDADGFDHWRMGQMGFRTDWKSGEKDTFTIQGDMYRGESGESSQIGSLVPSVGDGGTGTGLRLRRQSAGTLAAYDGQKAPTYRFKPTSTGPTGRTSNSVRRAIRSMWTSSSMCASKATRS